MQINAAIQLLPLKASEDKYQIIDFAIAMIKESGLTYKVCPFETVIEGNATDVYKLIERIQNKVLQQGCDELILNIKIHAANRNLSFADKLKNY